jgi:hypothetical protein
LEQSGTEIYATAAIDAADRTKVTVDPAVTLTRDTEYTLGLTIYTAANTLYYKNPIDPGARGPLFIAGSLISFTTSNVDERKLVSTNLYTALDGTVLVPPAAATPTFPVDKTLEFTFDTAFPAEAVVTAELRQGGNLVDAEAEIDGAKVTVDPRFALTSSTLYTLNLKIQNPAKTITYYAPRAAGVQGPLYTTYSAPDYLINFTPAGTAQLSLVRTNLYTNPETTQPAAAAANNLYYFAVDGDIVLTFKEDIPVNAEITAVLKDTDYNTQSAVVNKTGKVITINPAADLKPGTIYYLQLKVVSGNAKKITLYELTSAGGLLVAGSQAFNQVPFSDTAWYIGFSTEVVKPPVLVSAAGLYRDNDVTKNGEYYFPVNGKFELTFDNIPAGFSNSNITNVYLSTSTTLAVPRVPVRWDYDGAGKVTIEPLERLNSSAYYYLGFILTDNGSSIWTPSARSNTSNITGPVYINVASGVHAIRVRTEEAFAIQPSATSRTNITAASIGTSFDARNDVVIEFNKPVATVTRADLLYVDATFVYELATASATAADLSQDGKILTIKTTNLLAPAQSFYVRLKVTSTSGEILVYDPTDLGVLATYVGGTVHAETGITTLNTTYLAGTVKQPKSAGTLVATELGTGAGGNLVIPDTDTTVDLTLTPIEAAPFARAYAVYRARQGTWNTTSVGTINVALGSIAAATVANVPLLGLAVHIDDEAFYYRVRGVDKQGYAIEATTTKITFTP